MKADIKVEKKYFFFHWKSNIVCQFSFQNIFHSEIYNIENKQTNGISYDFSWLFILQIVPLSAEALFSEKKNKHVREDDRKLMTLW